jgi:hypothetical protein
MLITLKLLTILFGTILYEANLCKQQHYLAMLNLIVEKKLMQLSKKIRLFPKACFFINLEEQN